MTRKNYTNNIQYFNTAVFFKLTAGIFILCIFFSCRTIRKVTTQPPAVIVKTDTTPPPPAVQPVNENEATHADSIRYIQAFMDSVQMNAINFNSFSAKLDINFEGANGKKIDVNGTLRMQKDSIIWISITSFLGEALRAVITVDSVKILNKIEGNIYMPRSISYLQELIPLPVNLSTLQQLLIGNPVFTQGTAIGYNMNSNSETTITFRDAAITHLFTALASKNWSKSLLTESEGSNNGRSCELLLTEYENKNGISFAMKRRITVNDKNKLDIGLKFKQYSFNETLSFPFSLPRNYKTRLQ